MSKEKEFSEVFRQVADTIYNVKECDIWNQSTPQNTQRIYERLDSVHNAIKTFFC